MADNARGRVKVERGQKRVRVYLQNRLVADTLRPLMVWEGPHYPTILPAGDGRPRRPEADRRERALAESRRRAGARRADQRC